MKRLLPVLIVACLIGAVFCCLPGNRQNYKQPKTLAELDGCKVGIQTGLNYEDYLAKCCPGAEPVFFSEFWQMGSGPPNKLRTGHCKWGLALQTNRELSMNIL